MDLELRGNIKTVEVLVNYHKYMESKSQALMSNQIDLYCSGDTNNLILTGEFLGDFGGQLDKYPELTFYTEGKALYALNKDWKKGLDNFILE